MPLGFQQRAEEIAAVDYGTRRKFSTTRLYSSGFSKLLRRRALILLLYDKRQPDRS